MGIGHVRFDVADLDKLTEFYLKALAPLGYRKIMQPVPHVVGLGTLTGGPDFWLAGPCPESETKTGPTVSTSVHLAFSTRSRAAIRAFHKAALEAGATCNGPPGLRRNYMSTYYAAFVIDPEGRNIEVVSLLPGFWTEDKPFWGLMSTVIAVAGAGAARWWGLW